MSVSTVERVEKRVAELHGAWPNLSVLALTIQAAVELGFATDSRELAKGLDSAHALVLREIETLSENGLLVIDGRNDRTMRARVSPVSERAEEHTLS